MGDRMKAGKNFNIKDLPNSINIFSVIYDVSYHLITTEVDSGKKKSLFGQVDYWDRTIRIYYKDRTIEDVFMTLLHEILHVVDDDLEMGLFEGEYREKKINILTTALFDTLKRNNWLKFP